MNLYRDHKSTWVRVDHEFRSKHIIFSRKITTKRYFDRFEDHLSGFNQIFSKYIYKVIKCILIIIYVKITGYLLFQIYFSIIGEIYILVNIKNKFSQNSTESLRKFMLRDSFRVLCPSLQS